MRFQRGARQWREPLYHGRTWRSPGCLELIELDGDHRRLFYALSVQLQINPSCLPLPCSYERQGMRRSVEGILLVQEHNHPHIIMLQLDVAFFRLPGGRLRAGEDGENWGANWHHLAELKTLE